MANHQHVEMLIDRVDRERTGRIGARRKHVGQSGDLDDVRSVAAAGAFGVEAVDRPSLDRGDRVVDESDSLSVSVWMAIWMSYSSATVRLVSMTDGSGAPILVELETTGAGLNLINQELGQAAVPFTQDADIDREPLECLEHVR